jgi:hypothetical protein
VRRLLSVDRRVSTYLAVLATPWLSELFIGRRPLLSCNRVTPETELVVEGFPRSANTSVAVQFAAAHPDARLSSHLHTPRSLARASRFGVPALLLVRDPDAAVASLRAMMPGLTPHAGYDAWRRYHRHALRNVGGCLVVDFAQATGSFAELMALTDARFGTSFAEGVRELPADERDALIDARAVRDFQAGVYEARTSSITGRPHAGRTPALQVETLDPGAQRARERAQRLYRELAAHASGVESSVREHRPAQIPRPRQQAGAQPQRVAAGASQRRAE